jgi:hypothetical protein
MAASEQDSEQGQGEQGEPAMPRDLIDFYQRWSDFRLTVTRLADRSDLSPLERQTITWLVLLVDRISDHDLQPLKRQ